MVILTGPATDEFVGPNRRQGFLDGLKEGGLPYEIKAEQAGDYAQDKGQVAAENMLAGNPDIDLILGLNDSMALGAYNVVNGKDQYKNVYVAASADGQKEALALIKQGGCEGRYISTGLNSPSFAAEEALKISVDVATGKTRSRPTTRRSPSPRPSASAARTSTSTTTPTASSSPISADSPLLCSATSSRRQPRREANQLAARRHCWPRDDQPPDPQGREAGRPRTRTQAVRRNPPRGEASVPQREQGEKAPTARPTLRTYPSRCPDPCFWQTHDYPAKVDRTRRRQEHRPGSGDRRSQRVAARGGPQPLGDRPAGHALERGAQCFTSGLVSGHCRCAA